VRSKLRYGDVDKIIRLFVRQVCIHLQNKKLGATNYCSTLNFRITGFRMDLWDSGDSAIPTSHSPLWDYRIFAPSPQGPLWDYIHSGHVALPAVLPKVHHHPEPLYSTDHLRLTLYKLTGWVASLDLRKPYTSRILSRRSVPRSPTSNPLKY